jgi:hypothetical protein
MAEANVFNLYRLLGSEPRVWHEQAEGLLHCAVVLCDHLIARHDVPPTDRRVETNGLVNSIMLLLGLSIENAVKGAYIARHPELVTREKLNQSLWNGDGGHALRLFAARLIQLTVREADLLDRLQEHVVWAGRYPIPLKANRFYRTREPVNRRTFHMADIDLARSLIYRLQRVSTGGEPSPDF